MSIGRGARASKPIRRTNLPDEVTSFLGRDVELGRLREALAKHRMVTVTGAGGMGKTRTASRLAAEMVEEFPDGVWFIGLEALADPALVTQEVANGLLVREVPGTELIEKLCAQLRSWSCLLVLDNCEHVAEHCAAIANRLLASCPKVKILATSRQPTGAAIEHVWRLPPLSVGGPPAAKAAAGQGLSEAARLFVERAWPDLEPSRIGADRSDAIAQICRRLEGIPLAIELAAARARVMSVDELLVRLDDRLKVLSGGHSSAPRHQTMRATVEWSYQLLDAVERALFRRLAVFSGGFTVREVEEICSGDAVDRNDVMDLLARLVDKSLVLPVEVGDMESPMRVLATLQQFAQERLSESGEATKYARRHAEHFLDLAEQARNLQNSPEHAGRLDLLEHEHDNLRAALAASQSISAALNLRLATALIGFWDERGHLTEGSDWLGRALVTWPEETAFRADALGAAGWLAQRMGAFERASEYLEDSARIAADVSELNVRARSLRNLALVMVLGGGSRRARPLVEEAHSISAQLGDRAGTAGALLVMALAAYFQGELEPARTYGEQSLALHRALGDEKVAAFLLACLATLALDRDDVETARANLRESIEISHRLHEKVDVAFVLESSARLAATSAEPARAIMLAAAAAGIRRAAGAPAAPVWSVVVDAGLAAARKAVGKQVADAAAKEGAALTLEQAVEQAREWLASDSHPPSHGDIGASPGSGLSRRELEIAALVGRGLRNREIAGGLFLSVRTVDAHVEHIRDKLDFHSRAQIAAWAVAQGLVTD
jgi:predicted ATPase/DNA-binding CsgD family transcriptional regulator